MLRVHSLSAVDVDPVVQDAGDVIVAQVPVSPSQQEAEFLDAVSKAASAAATSVVVKGLVGFGAISVASMASRALGLGFFRGALLVAGVSTVASQALK